MPILFAFALFCSAFLSFSVQPLLGKMLLPLVGGAPAAWIVVLAFFQLSLLAGYGVSYALGRLSPFAHTGGLLALYAIGLFFLPPHLRALDSGLGGLSVSWAVIRALTCVVFVPFLALTATTSALQRVFAATTHKTAKDPYYLFVASNAGSFAGLLAFPFALEPFWGIRILAKSWEAFYFVAIAAIAAALIMAWQNRRPVKAAVTQVKVEPIPRDTIIQWLILAFVPCSLSMGVTTLITTDVGGLPLFWVIPLGLYLLTFILAFTKRSVSPQQNLNFWHLVSVIFLIWLLVIGVGYQPTGSLTVFLFFAAVFLAVFFAIAWACHQRLADMRPKTEHLTLFYLVVAAGGGLAGIVHAFIIPFVLPDVVEFPIAVFLTLLLHPLWSQPMEKNQHRLFNIAFWAGLAAFFILAMLRYVEASRYVVRIASFIVMMSVLLLAFQPRRLFIIGLLVFVAGYAQRYPGDMIERGRNFFGNYAIYDKTDQTGVRLIRYFVHGNTTHGIEIRTENDSNYYYTSYYARNNPIRDIIAATKARSMGVVGLGAGQMACYDTRVQMDFYEIDPTVEKIAREYFSYLKKCPPRNIFLGDGRLQIAKIGRKYDVIMLDAFTSDGIPIHILTREALQLYRTRLNPKGVMLFHISNRYLNLAPPLAAGARALGLTAYRKVDRSSQQKLTSHWVAIPLNAQTGKALAAQGWSPIQATRRPWTDDRSALISAFMFR